MNPSAAFDAGVPVFGTGVLYAFMVAAALTFALSIGAATAPRDQAPRLLRAARLAALGTCALVALDVLLLLYAFVSHDFRIRYVSHYSDRSMPGIYLITALWGGQDGSLLWWTFLLSLYSAACVLWLKGRYRELAPYIIATLMGIVIFFAVLMAFAANPFALNLAGAPREGEGLNPSLQNFYMAIHPPSLYIGFVGCSVPFAFAVAALLSGRLDEEWIRGVRKWALFAWLFLSIGNTLGMLWAYEELGWGGFWAWDPVENAACMPWFTCTAFLHSVMIQERRRSLKIWNVVLIMLTFFLTIFGTFLTRSGLIASIHSFANSDIGIYFVWFMAFLVAFGVALVVRRYARLTSETEIDSVLSREAMFVANNWLLLGICSFIVIATTWPKISEWVWKERLTVGASFYNFWLPLPGCVLLALVGIGTLTPWRKASPKLLWEAFRGPLIAGAVVAAAHVVFGARIGHPAYVHIEPIYPSAVGRLVAAVNSRLPPVFWSLAAFNITALLQEFWRGARARAKAKHESTPLAFVRLVARNRRRYGGYVVHFGIVMMFFGWTGTYWKSETEALLQPGQTFTLGRYAMRYQGVEHHRDPNKREEVANIVVLRDGRPYVVAHPAKYTYTTHPDQPTSEVSITMHWHEDLYLVLASVNPMSGQAHLKAFLNPFTVWIWLGCLMMMLGCAVAMWPELQFEWLRALSEGKGDAADSGGPLPPRAEGVARTREGAALLALLALGAAAFAYAGRAHAQGHTMSQPPPVGGNAESMTAPERLLFARVLCMCGDCQRLPLATCTCDFAAATRESMRQRLRNGMSADDIVQRYAARFGAAALAVPPDAGHNRAVYAIPFVALAAGGVLGALMVRRWRARGVRTEGAAKPTGTPGPKVNAPKSASREEYDRRLDEELRGLDD